MPNMLNTRVILIATAKSRASQVALHDHVMQRRHVVVALPEALLIDPEAGLLPLVVRFEQQRSNHPRDWGEHTISGGGCRDPKLRRLHDRPDVVDDRSLGFRARRWRG